MNASKSTILIIVLLLVILCCCISVAVFITGGAVWATQAGIDDFLPTEPFYDYDGEAQSALRITPTVEVVRVPVASGAYETLETLQNETVPVNDPRDLAQRLDGTKDIPRVFSENPVVYAAGDKKEFWVSNTDTNETFKVSTRLAYQREHVYFWIEDGVRYKQKALNALVDTFEERIYPTNREFFGSEWTPGIDGDPHLYIVLAGNIGSGIAGYFSSADSVHPLAHKFSNAHEMFVLNADNLSWESDFTKGVLAHEFQHMIHWYQDRNEETWLNEGFSELASFLNGYDVGGFDFVFVNDPDIQLTDWPTNGYGTTPHYGAAFMFVTYFLDRFGELATQALVSHPDNGMDSVDRVLNELNQKDIQTGETLTADDVFADWVVANYLQDGDVEDGRYAYSNYPKAPRTYETETFEDCATPWQERTVSQYGTDYIRITCPGTYSFQFEGSTRTKVMAADPYSGEYAFWSNKGDESDMTLWQEFDFTDVDEPIILSYRTWFDLEKDYDYLYLTVSEGEDLWEILTTPSGTDTDPSGNSYGWGYNGKSADWLMEEVDLSRFEGKKVRIQFEYVTDAAVNGEGFLLDDLEIPAIGYFTDFEQDAGGWNSEGFVRLKNQLPQQFVISTIQSGETVTVDTYKLEEGTLEFPMALEKKGDWVTVAVSGVTRFTRQPAAYRFRMKSTLP